MLVTQSTKTAFTKVKLPQKRKGIMNVLLLKVIRSKGHMQQQQRQQQRQQLSAQQEPAASGRAKQKTPNILLFHIKW